MLPDTDADGPHGLMPGPTWQLMPDGHHDGLMIAFMVVYMACWWPSWPDGSDGMMQIICSCMYCIVLYCIVWYCMVWYCIVLYCIVLYCIVLYWIVSYCIVLVLYCICNVLYCIILLQLHMQCNVSAYASSSSSCFPGALHTPGPTWQLMPDGHHDGLMIAKMVVYMACWWS